MSDITQLLSQIDSGDPHAAEQLLPLVYDQLRKLATQKMAQEIPGQTLQATALVHEVYLRLTTQEAPHWDSRGHFFSAAAKAMRRILVETARRKRRIKHGGEFRRIDVAEQMVALPNDDLVALDEALTLLAAEDAQAAKAVELRYFAGLSHEEVARVLDITVYRARQKWTYARAWLRHALQAD